MQVIVSLEIEDKGCFEERRRKSEEMAKRQAVRHTDRFYSDEHRFTYNWYPHVACISVDCQVPELYIHF
jgi:hypothetical protein